MSCSRVRALYRIPAQPEGPAEARRIIAEELAARVPAAVLDEIKLMVSELVTNGIMHGSADAQKPNAVTLDLIVNGSVHCRVLDHGPGFARLAGHDGPGGWGLQVVEQLADQWGMRSSGRRTEVWFERGCA